MLDLLERYFGFSELGTTWRTELLAGATTFATMAYIIFVNPAILAAAGMPSGAVAAATCISSGLASILMGTVARYPLVLAPGMGLNAYFAYTVVSKMGVPWQTALGAVFLSGAAFLALTLAGFRQRLMMALPKDLAAAVAAGIGLFLAFIGLRNAGIVAADPATAVTLGNLAAPQALLALAGLLTMAVLSVRAVPAAILAGIAVSFTLGIATGVYSWTPKPQPISALAETAFHLDIAAAMRLGLLEILIVFLFVDLFDNIGTTVAVTRHAGLTAPDGSIPRVGHILTADAIATMTGAALGTSTVVSYVESSAGIAAGGRSGVTAIVTGLLFFAALVVTPLVGTIPAPATAAALVLVGAAMLGHVASIDWTNPGAALPAFLTIATIPLTFSIANGLAIGFTAHCLIRLLTGRAREVSPLLYVLSALFVARFAYLGG
jgi:AGZA family xanthine/uracil permease-like MFS transporter